MSEVRICRYLVFWALKKANGPSRRVKAACRGAAESSDLRNRAFVSDQSKMERSVVRGTRDQSNQQQMNWNTPHPSASFQRFLR